jgi:hypothetical protein
MTMPNDNQTTSESPSCDATCYAIFTGRGGYPDENKCANATFEIGKKYIITGGTVGQSHTSLKIQGFEGRWNSVMFDFDWQSAPLEFPYLNSRHNSLYSPTSISICFGGLKFLSWPVWLRKEFDVNDQGGRRAPQNGTGFDQESWMVRAAVVS